MIKNIFFDLDGTLIDSAGDITVAINTMRKNFNLEPVSKDIVANVIGKGYPNTVRKMLGLDLDDIHIENIIDEAIQIVSDTYISLNSANTTIYTGVLKTLQCLQQKNIRMAIVTNKEEGAAIETLQHLGLGKYFEAIVGGDTTDNYKPNPEPLMYAIKQLDASISESIMVGDSINDYKCAEACGMKTILLNYGYSNGVDLKSLDAFAHIDDFTSLTKFI